MVFLQPHLTIHLEDVYYAGTGDQEKHLLVDLWPKGSLGALTLNSNHEMYSGAKPYFEEALGSSLFGIQQGRSFFALENDDWVIVGLDSAYYSDAEGLYMDGALFQDGGPQLQLDFLKQQAAKSKKTIVLTHHNGLTEDGSTTTNLWSQVMSASPDGTAPAYWYWGVPPRTVRPLLTGIGVTYTQESSISPGRRGPRTRERTLSLLRTRRPAVGSRLGVGEQPEYPVVRATPRQGSGHSSAGAQRLLYLNGPGINEVFYDENGGVAWP
jgi:hypothetical protein